MDPEYQRYKRKFPAPPGISTCVELLQVFLLNSQAAVLREKTGREEEQLLQRFFQERDALNLQARTAGDVTIPTTAITIIDFTDEIPGDELEIEILIDDPHAHLTAADTE